MIQFKEEMMARESVRRCLYSVQGSTVIHTYLPILTVPLFVLDGCKPKESRFLFVEMEEYEPEIHVIEGRKLQDATFPPAVDRM